MRTIYYWAMRNGSQLLFAVSALLVLTGLAQSLAVADTGPVELGSFRGTERYQLLVLISAISSGINAAVFPFIGAVLVHRWDRSGRYEGSKAGEREEA